MLYEQEFLSKFLREFQVDFVLDVGANAGQYAQMLRRRAGYKGVIVSCEPIPKLASFLREQAAADPFWYVEEVALSEAAGLSTFNVMERDEFSSLHAPSADQVAATVQKNRVSRTIQVRLDTAASLFAKYKNEVGFTRAYLKMDTQGHDREVVIGAGKWLEEIVGLQSELAIHKLYDGSPRYDEALADYTARGFALSALFPNNAGNFPDMLEMDCVMYRRSFVG